VGSPLGQASLLEWRPFPWAAPPWNRQRWAGLPVWGASQRRLFQAGAAHARPAPKHLIHRSHTRLAATVSVATLGSRVKREHVEFLQGFSAGVRPCVYLLPHRDDAGRQMWRECRAAFGDRLRTVLMPEGMKDVGDLAEKAATPAQVFGRLVDEAR